MSNPTIRHKTCETAFVAKRLVWRHGRLNIDPLYCPKCREALDEHNIEAVDELAHKLLEIAGVEKEPVKDTLMAGMIDRWTDLEDALKDPLPAI